MVLKLWRKKWLVWVLVFALSMQSFAAFAVAQADISSRHIPGTMLALSDRYSPAFITGMTLYPDNPLKFDFILNTGDDHYQGAELGLEAQRMIKYFFTALTVPDAEMWVNLSPYEQDRIIGFGLGGTVMGRDMLEQDYFLKQLAASITYPEGALGKVFWETIYADLKDGNKSVAEIANLFNKIWIVPQDAAVHVRGQNVFVTQCRLKVLLAQEPFFENSTRDLALAVTEVGYKKAARLTQIFRETLLPVIEKEINEGRNFARLRQMYQSMVLAAWYKNKIKAGLLKEKYVDQNKTQGVALNRRFKNTIYQQYLETVQKGSYNYIREEESGSLEGSIPRHYFAGGLTGVLSVKEESLSPQRLADFSQQTLVRVFVQGQSLQQSGSLDLAMLSFESMMAVLQEHLPNIIERKKKHVFLVVDSLKKFVAKDFDGLYQTLPDENNDKEQYVFLMGGLHGFYEKMSVEGKKALEALAVFHDIGNTNDVRHWVHNENSSRIAKNILLEMNVAPAFIDRVARLIILHGSYASLGVDLLPKDLDALSEEDKDILLIFAIIDASSRESGNFIVANKIEDLLTVRNRDQTWPLGDALFYQYRLGNLFRPVIFTERSGRVKHRASLMAGLTLRNIVDDDFLDNWNNLVRVHAFALFFMAKDRSIAALVNFIEALNTVINSWKAKESIIDVIVDSDIDLMGMPFEGWRESLRVFLEQVERGDAVPMDVTLTEGVLRINIRLLPEAAAQAAVVTPGGIDFNPESLYWNETGDEIAIAALSPSHQQDASEDMRGIFPVITGISSISNPAMLFSPDR